jgi:uncharacterized protein (TIGR00251 family)
VEGPSTRLRLRVSPGAARSEIVGRHGEAWKVRVGAPPESGRANEALVELLASTLGVPKRAVELISGHGSRDKTIVVHGITEEDVEARFAAPAGAR